MNFASGNFFLFLILLVGAYYLVPKSCQWKLLLVASYVFYAFAGWWAVCYLLATTLTTWLVTRRVGQIYTLRDQALGGDGTDKERRKSLKSAAKRKAKGWSIAGGVLCIGMLAVVKYTDFVFGELNRALAIIGLGQLRLPHFLLPMGISFYIFQSVGYIIDVYRETCAPEKNLGKAALFISFFPQLIQGPISRFGDLAPSLFATHRWDGSQVGLGAQRILWGLFKKLVVADRLMPVVQTLSGDPKQYQGTFVIVLMVVYAVTLYADFTGGIDITIGAAQCLGVTVAENFQRPFFSKNTAEYWRRWHISMGTWFRDYIFYPLSVSAPMLALTRRCRRKGHPRLARRLSVYAVTLLTWFITGLWHGASWNFIVWGLLNGAVILISQELSPLYGSFHARFPKLGGTFGYRAFQIARTFLLMSSIRVLDCYRDVPVTFRALGSVFTRWDPAVLWNGALLELGVSRSGWAVAGVGAALMLSVSLLSRRGSLRGRLSRLPLSLRWSLFGFLLLATILFGAYGMGYDAAGFIYNQF